MATIDNLIIGVSANASGLTKELRRAESEVNMFAMKMQTSGNAGVAAVGNIIQNMPVALEGFKEAAGPVGILTTAIGGLMYGMKGVAEEFENLTNKADQFGVTVNDIKAFETLGDALSEDLFGGLGILQKKLGAAGAGDKEMQKNFRDIGLDWEHLTKIPLDKAFEEIADEVAKSNSRMDQATIATEAFGKSGARLLPILSQGAEGLAKAKAELKFSGGMVSDSDIQKMQALDKLFDRLGRLWSGIKVKSSGALISILDTMERMSSGGTLLQPVEAAKHLTEGQLAAAKAARELREEVSKTLDKFEEQAEFAGMSARAIEIEKMRRKGATQEELAAMIKLAEEARKNEENEKLLDDAAELNNKFIEQAELLGKVGREAEIAKLKLRGINEQWVEQLNMKAHDLELGEIFNKLDDQLKNLGADAGEQLLMRLQEMGATAEQIFDAAFAIGVMDRAKELKNLKDPGLPKAMVAGSSEAISAMNKFRSGAAFKDIHARLQEENNKEVMEARKVLQELLKVVKKQDPPKIVEMN